MRHLVFIVWLAVGAGAGLSSVAQAQTCAVNVPHVTGEWVTLPYQMPINPISATLLHTGQVLIVAGSENDAKNNSEGSESYRAAVWDPTGTTQSSIAVQNLTYDVFCSGTAALPDGRALVVGGTSDYSFTGENRASIFNPVTGSFVQSQSMADGRWYATATALGDGRIMTFSGLSLSGGTNSTVEIYDLKNAGAGWTAATAAPFSPPLYPHMALLPNGTVFFTGQGGGGSNANGWIFNPAAGTWTISAPTTRSRSYGSTVLLPLLPPSYTPKVMAFGGGNPATSTTETIDLSRPSPAWTPGPNMSTGRIQMDAVILPDGTVLALGGSVNNEAPDTPGKKADLYHPVTGTFTSAGTASYSRLYHSAALLLPDARVMSMGSNPANRGTYEPAIEIYSPAYLFDSSDRPITTNRPGITAITPVSGVVGYNASFSVSYTSTSAISSAVLVRPGSVTHTFDMDQRLIGLCGPSPQPPCSGAPGTLNLTSPLNGNIAPPGYYMLFLLDGSGVPSKAQFIQLTDQVTSPPVGAITSPASDVTIAAGGSVSFSTSTTAAKYSWVFPGGSPATSVAQTPGNVTFGTPGTYTTSLTVIDSSGNSDPNPPTRTITVTPPTADFSIAVSPPGQLVTPGQSTTFTVTVTPITGFAGTVSLNVGSESAFPTGITSGGFSPASINGSGSSTLTMNTTTSTVPYALSLTITGTSGTLTHTASTTLMVTLAPPASLTATPSNAQVSLSWPASVGASSYHVKRAAVSGGPYVTVACPTTTNYADTGLSNGTTYYYVVSAAYTGGPVAGGESADSTEASATPQAVTPLPPTGLTATPGNAQVALAWNASAGAASYNVKRATVSGGPYTTAASPISTNYTDTGLTNGATYYYVVTAVNSAGESGNSSEASATPQASASLPPPWVEQDIGSPSLAGSASYASGVFTVKGSGADIEDASDQFHYVYQSVSGDVTVLARVASIQNTDSWAKGGVMIRETLAANSKHAMMVLTPGNGLAFQRRITTGGLTTHTQGAVVAAPYWVKLVRSGNIFSGYSSPDGVAWTLVGSDTVTMSAGTYVGLPLTSHNTAALCTATFGNVSATGAPANNPPSVSITSPVNGATFTAPASIAINATASDSDGTVAKVDFYQNGNLLGTDTTTPYSFTWTNVAAGSYSLTAVATDNLNKTGTSSPISITVSGPNAPPSVTITSPANGATFTAPASIQINATASDSDGTVTKVDFYQNGNLLGTDTTSPYSFTWSNVAAGSYSLTAVATDNLNMTGTSTPISITVSGPNVPPSVSITSPVNGATFTAPASIPINATASDSNGTVTKVDFYQNGNLLGTDTTSPYSFTWSNVPAGNYSFTARATDNGGATTTSSAVSVTVGSSSATFSLSTSPSTRNIKAGSGGNATYTVTITPSGGFTGTVSLTVTSALPSGATASFSPSTVSITGGAASATMTVGTSSGTPPGKYTVTISGTSGGLTRTASVILQLR
jgi:fibronectin type 3 domain-containing protein